jgi:hypothetical protein
VLVGFFQSFSIFNSSQIFFLASFLSLIGFLIWFAQPLSTEDSECSENKDDEKQKVSSTASSSSSSSAITSKNLNGKKLINTIREDEENDRSESFSKVARDALKSSGVPLANNRYQIDTIYESANEHIYEIQEKTIQNSSSPSSPPPPISNITKILESAVVHDHRESSSNKSNNDAKNDKFKSDKNKNETYLNQYFISNQLNEMSSQNTNVTNSSSSSLASSRYRLEKLESSDDGTNDLINNLINNLIVDEELDTVERKKTKPLTKGAANSFSSENITAKLENEFQNSLLGKY